MLCPVDVDIGRRAEPKFTSLQNLIMSYLHTGEVVPSYAVTLTACFPPPRDSGAGGLGRKASVYNGFGGDDEGNTEA